MIDDTRFVTDHLVHLVDETCAHRLEAQRCSFLKFLDLLEIVIISANELAQNQVVGVGGEGTQMHPRRERASQLEKAIRIVVRWIGRRVVATKPLRR